MSPDVDRETKASYGLDAPAFLPIALVAFLANVVLGVMERRPGPFVGATILAWCVGFYLHTTRRGKFLVWGELLDGLGLRGDERLLDLGCGRGAVLLAAAKRLDTGRAVGVDIWSASDQSGNSPAAAQRNARLAGVAGRVALTTGDMTALPFAPGSFDVVVSNVAIHNIRGRAARLAAIDEAVRVLRPGGRLLLADLRGTRAYAERLAALGMGDVRRRTLGWRMWWGGPWGATRLVSATKAG